MTSSPIQPLPELCDQVDFWLIDLTSFHANATAVCLSDAEVAKARAFHDPLHRLHYEAAHRALRHLLSQATDMPSNDLIFGTGTFGKPFLQMPNAPGFNMAHCENWALIGIATNNEEKPPLELGLDLEVWRAIPDAKGMAQHFCSVDEAMALAARHQPEQASNRSFLNLWTRKEACLKATGTGLQLDPRTVQVGLEARAVTIALHHQAHTAQVRVESIDLAARKMSAAFAWLLP